MIDLNGAQKMLSEGLSFLKSLGFDEPTISIERSKLLGDSLLMTYTSATARRQIEVSFAPAKAERSAAISMFICDYSGERFSAEDWVVKKAPDSRLQFLADGPSTDEQDFLHHFCITCREVLEGPLRGTVAGREWDAVAFDWKGYR